MSAGLEVAPVLSPEDLVSISSDVWSCFLGGEQGSPLVTGEPSLAEGTEAVYATVGISGAWNGQVVLELPLSAADAAARAMLGSDDVAPAEVTDAVGELLNMVGGNLKGLVPGPSALGLPLVIKGTAIRFAAYECVEICKADLGWAGEPIRISVWAEAPENERQGSRP